MLARAYLIVGSVFLGGYAALALLGRELSNPDRSRPAPPPGALVAAASRGWAGRSATYRSSTSSSGRGWGFIFGGK